MSDSESPACAILSRKKREQAGSAHEPYVFKPHAIYFDTNPLLGAGWPNPSAQLLQVMNEADRLGFPLCLPEVVSNELEAHIMRELAAEWRKTNSQIDTLNKKAYIPQMQNAPHPPPLTESGV